MRKKIVAGNWKMNLTLEEANTLFADLNAASSGWPAHVDVIVAVPSLYLQAVETEGYALAAQACSHHEFGAFTGDVSAKQIASLGVEHSLVGHSERRAYHMESNEQLLAMIHQCLVAEVTPVFCFGEDLSERESGRFKAVIKKQLEEVVFQLSEAQMGEVILAYEPVWAIGTGKTASAEQAQEVHAFVRGLLEEKFGPTIADSTSILYGGSCKPSNALALFAGEDVDGGLIGGASLKAADFSAIIQARA